MNNAYEILVMLGMFAATAVIIYILARYIYLTKKAILENGGVMTGSQNRSRYAEWGSIVLAIGLGLMASSVFPMMNMPEDTMDLLVFGTVMLFGGIGLIIAQYIRKRFDN